MAALPTRHSCFPLGRFSYKPYTLNPFSRISLESLILMVMILIQVGSGGVLFWLRVPEQLPSCSNRFGASSEFFACTAFFGASGSCARPVSCCSRRISLVTTCPRPSPRWDEGTFQTVFLEPLKICNQAPQTL